MYTHIYKHTVLQVKDTHLLFTSSILSVGTIMFPYSSTFWKDWKVFTCCGISSRHTYSNIKR